MSMIFFPCAGIHRRGGADMYGKGQRIAIIEGCRTPFMRSGTGYYDMMGWEIGRHAVKGLMSRVGLSSDHIGHVIMGTVAADISTPMSRVRLCSERACRIEYLPIPVRWPVYRQMPRLSRGQT
ncbi:MAG: hypothetical protein E4G96_10445 [Chrysiogenales bacterium]|nr:MAG: hypothetical protein E4G96_10445 [Chrysiogenales bacterium]